MSTYAQAKARYQKIYARIESLGNTPLPAASDKLRKDLFQALMESVIAGHQEGNDISIEYENFKKFISSQPHLASTGNAKIAHDIKRVFAKVPAPIQRKFFTALHANNYLTRLIEETIEEKNLLPLSVQKSIARFMAESIPANPATLFADTSLSLDDVRLHLDKAKKEYERRKETLIELQKEGRATGITKPMEELHDFHQHYLDRGKLDAFSYAIKGVLIGEMNGVDTQPECKIIAPLLVTSPDDFSYESYKADVENIFEYLSQEQIEILFQAILKHQLFFMSLYNFELEADQHGKINLSPIDPQTLQADKNLTVNLPREDVYSFLTTKRNSLLPERVWEIADKIAFGIQPESGEPECETDEDEKSLESQESPDKLETLNEERENLLDNFSLLSGMELHRKGYKPADYHAGIKEGTSEPVLTDNDGEEIEPLNLPDIKPAFTLPTPVWNETYDHGYSKPVTPDFIKIPSAGSGLKLVGEFDFNATYFPLIIDDQLTVIEVENLLPDGEIDNSEKGIGRRRVFGSAAELRTEERYNWVLDALREDGFKNRDLVIYRDRMLSGVDLRHHPYIIIEACKNEHYFQIAVCQTVGHATFIIRDPIDLRSDARVTRSELKNRPDVYQISCHNPQQYVTNIRHYAYSSDPGEQVKTRTYWAKKIEPFLKVFSEHYAEHGSIPPTYDQTIVTMSNGERTTFRRMYGALYNGSIEGLEKIKTKEGLELELQIKPLHLKDVFRVAVQHILDTGELPSNPHLAASLKHGKVEGFEEMGVDPDIKEENDIYVGLGVAIKNSNDNYVAAPPPVIKRIALLLG